MVERFWNIESCKSLYFLVILDCRICLCNLHEHWDEFEGHGKRSFLHSSGSRERHRRSPRCLHLRRTFLMHACRRHSLTDGATGYFLHSLDILLMHVFTVQYFWTHFSVRACVCVHACVCDVFSGQPRLSLLDARESSAEFRSADPDDPPLSASASHIHSRSSHASRCLWTLSRF